MELIPAVERTDEFDSAEEARDAARATLETLGERLARGEAMDIADFLGPDPTAWIVEDQHEAAAEFDAEEFIERVADREGVSKQVAHRHAQAVFDGLESAVPGSELRRARTQLPDGYGMLFS
ncbi:MAG: DUF2267 domain-containing protein [Haloplanus sp.]